MARRAVGVAHVMTDTAARNPVVAAAVAPRGPRETNRRAYYVTRHGGEGRFREPDSPTVPGPPERHGQGYTRPVNITCQNRGGARASESKRRGGEWGRGRGMYERVAGRVPSRGETHPDGGVSLAREQPQAAATSARDIGGEGNRFKGDEPSFLLFIILPGGLHGGARSTPHALATAATRTSVARCYGARCGARECARAGVLIGSWVRREAPANSLDQ